MTRIGKKLAAVFLAITMIITSVPALGTQTVYAAVDTITRVDLAITPDNLDDTFYKGDPVIQPEFTVTSVESELGTVNVSDLEFISDQWLGWCQYIEDGDWFKYQEDGIQDLFFTGGESRMMVDLWVDTDKADAAFTSDTEVYLNGRRMYFYKLYDSDTDWVGFLSRTALGSVVSEINIQFDTETLGFITANKEWDVSNRISDGGVTADGEGYHNIDWGDALQWKNPGDTEFNWNALSYEKDDYLTTDLEYSIFINAITLDDGWDYPDSIKTSSDYFFLSGDVSDLIVKVNGTVRDDVELHYIENWSSYGQILGVNIPIGKPAEVYVAPDVELRGSTEPMEPGHTRNFEAEVTGTIFDRTIVWSVTGNNSTATTITGGVLKIGTDETAASITITAAAAADGALKKTLTIPLTYEIKPVDAVEISPTEAIAFRGYTRQFTANVLGEQENKEVLWNVSDNKSTGTTVSETGLLTVALEESASSVTVTAISVADPAKSASAVVSIQDSLTVDEIDIRFDMEALGFDFLNKEWDVSGRISGGGVTAAGAGYHNIDWGDALHWKNPGDPEYNWNALAYETEDYLRNDREYSIFINAIALDDGCDYPDSIKVSSDYYFLSGDVSDLTVKVNGVVRDDVELHYIESWSSYGQILGLEIPLGKPVVDLDKVDFAKILDMMYTGEALTPTFTPKYNDMELVRDVDYTAEYSNNVNKGTAKITVKGIGNYTGTKTLTFQITAKKITPAITLSASSYVWDGTAKKPAVTVKDGSTTLTAADYTVAYKNNTNVGTATVTVTCKGNYTGTAEKTFQITAKQITPAVTLSAASYTWNGKAKKPAVTVKDGSTALTSDAYTVTYKNNKNVGKASVVVTLKGSYAGTKTVNFKINPKGTSIKKLTKASKAITVKWTKQSKKMSSARITGYQIQVATNSAFTKNKKTVNVKGYSKVSKKITKLKSGKKYYVRIRTYKAVNGTRYYSAWSKAKTVKTKK